MKLKSIDQYLRVIDKETGTVFLSDFGVVFMAEAEAAEDALTNEEEPDDTIPDPEADGGIADAPVVAPATAAVFVDLVRDEFFSRAFSAFLSSLGVVATAVAEAA